LSSSQPSAYLDRLSTLFVVVVVVGNIDIDMAEHSQVVEEKASSVMPALEEAASSTPTTAVAVPIPIPVPAILRVSGRASHLPHPLYDISSAEQPVVRQKRSNKRDEKEGKRWIRRKENGLSLPCLDILLGALIWQFLC
jgi:hypothetical protein